MHPFGGVLALSHPQAGQRVALRLAEAMGISQVLSRGRVSMISASVTTGRESGCLLTWNGRLDSEGDVLSALERSGHAALRSVIGDFALAFWDPFTGEVLLARDPFATRPLYYAITNEVAMWSSALTALINAADLPREIDDEYVAGHLVRGAPADRSPFAAVRRVRPGQALALGAHGLRSEPFWRPAFDPLTGLRTDRDYEERFLELFRESVRCRLRTGGNVIAELSGGVDSSSIVVIADDILRDGEGSAKRLSTVSYVFDEAAMSDERRYIGAVEEQRGVRGYHSNEIDHPLFAPIADAAYELPTPNLAGHRRNADLQRHMRAVGARVLLRGVAGDQIFWGEAGAPLEVSDHICHLRFSSAFRSMRAWRPHQPLPYTQLFWSTAIEPFLSPVFRRLTENERFIDEWLDPSFVRAHDLRARVFDWEAEREITLPSRREACRSLRDAIAMVSDAHDIGGGAFEAAYPFLHRPLVEFALRIPIEQHLRPGETRSLVRRAMRGLLPEKVRARTTKQGPGEALYRAIGRQWPHLRTLLDDARVVRRRYVREGALESMLRRARHGILVQIPALLRIVSLELWLRSLERRAESRMEFSTTVEKAAHHQ